MLCFSPICCTRVKARGPQCLVTSICGIRLTLSRHCQVYVLHTSYIVQTVSIYMVGPPSSCVFNNGKSVKQEGTQICSEECPGCVFSKPCCLHSSVVETRKFVFGPNMKVWLVCKGTDFQYSAGIVRQCAEYTHSPPPRLT